MEDVWEPDPISSTPITVTNSTGDRVEYIVDTYPKWGGHTVEVDKNLFQSVVKWARSATGKYVGLAEAPKSEGATSRNNPQFQLRSFILTHVIKGSVKNGAYTQTATSGVGMLHRHFVRTCRNSGSEPIHILCKCGVPKYCKIHFLASLSLRGVLCLDNGLCWYFRPAN
jgi:hypothetical protein